MKNKITPKFKRMDRVKYNKINEENYFIIDVVYNERPLVNILGNPINESHYDLKHPSIDYKGINPKWIPESDLTEFGIE